MEAEIFGAFLILGTMSTMLSRQIIDKCANYVERFVIRWDIANFQGGKCTFAPIYLKISAMEVEIFWALLIFGTISIMVWRRMLDKCANYVEIFVITLRYSDFQEGKCTFAPIYLKISAMEGEIFLAFIILGTMSTMLPRWIFDKCGNYVEIFIQS